MLRLKQEEIMSKKKLTKKQRKSRKALKKAFRMLGGWKGK
jgi:hypothetical protein